MMGQAESGFAKAMICVDARERWCFLPADPIPPDMTVPYVKSYKAKKHNLILDHVIVLVFDVNC